MFLEDFNLADSTAQRAEFDRVFISVDTKSALKAKAEAEAMAKAGRKAGPVTDEQKVCMRRGHHSQP